MEVLALRYPACVNPPAFNDRQHNKEIMHGTSLRYLLFHADGRRYGRSRDDLAGRAERLDAAARIFNDRLAHVEFERFQTAAHSG